MKGRTRFQIVVATDSYYFKVESRKDRILSVDELIAQLKKYTAKIEQANAAQVKS